MSTLSILGSITNGIFCAAASVYDLAYNEHLELVKSERSEDDLKSIAASLVTDLIGAVGTIPDTYCHSYGKHAACHVGYSDETQSMELSLKQYYQKSAADQTCNNEHCSSDHNLQFGTRLEVSLATNDDGARDRLVRFVLAMEEESGTEVSSAWTIRARPSETVVFDAASVESVVLGNPSAGAKKLVAEQDNVQLWEYHDATQPSSSQPTRALFVDASLRYTTQLAGAARTEAFIHPALLSHPAPSVVVLESDFPLPAIQEVLKHKQVETLAVFHANEAAMKIALEHLPQLNDCSDNNNNTHDATKCMDSPHLLYTIEPEFLDYIFAQDYIGGKVEAQIWERGPDVMLLDVIPTEEQLNFDLTFIKYLWEEGVDSPDTVLVFNAGYCPSDVVDSEDIEENDYRANFLRMAPREAQYGGLEMTDSTFHVYEEPNALPMATSYIFVTGDVINSMTYRRLMRKNAAAVDLDIARTMYKSSSSYIPTRQYDGATHLGYLRAPRAWESWYCGKKPWKYMTGCAEFLPKTMDTNYHVDKTEIRVHPVKGRNTYAVDDIPQGRIIIPDDAWQTIFFSDQQYKALFRFVKEVPSAVLYQQMLDVIDGYGFQVSSEGFGGFVCSTTNNTFTNHGCDEDTLNVGPLISYFTDEDGVYGNTFFAPIMARRAEITGVCTFSHREIKKGDEILMNYKYLRDSGEVRDSEASMCEDGGIIPIDQVEVDTIGEGVNV